MEVRPGYKQSEVGVIPEEWRVRPLGEIAHIKTGSRNNEDKVDDGAYPFFVRSPKVERINTYSHECEAILVPGEGNIGSIFHYINGRFDVHQRVYAITKFGQETSGRFVFYYVAQNFGRHAMKNTVKATVDSLRLPTFQKFEIPMPPTKAEQKAIAGALSDVDALIGALDRLIAKKRDLKQAAMQELLRPKDGWAVEKLEDIADVIDPHPSHRAPPAVPNGIPFVGIGDLNENGDLVGTKIRTVDPSVFDEHLTRYDLNEELIGLGRVASIGKVVKLKYTGAKYAISPTLGVIRGTKVRRDYLLYALKSPAVADQFNRIMSGSTRSSVGMMVLRKLDIALPTEEAKQTAIAEVLSDMDAELAALEQRRDKAHALKQGMMQELLTGRIRFV